MPVPAHPPAPPRRPPLGSCLAAITRPELYRNFAIHGFVMFPAAMVMAWTGARVDHALGLDPFLSPTGALALGSLLVASGAAWVWYVYGYLYLAGQGSPGSHVDGGPTWLVDTGPYTLVRHPSVLGKLVGVVGLGVAWRSTAFLVAFVPVLVAYSAITNRYLQERWCVERFGATYLRYRQRVPMFLPRWSGLRRLARGEGALGEFPDRAHAPSPPTIRNELRWYLVGLAGLLALFGVVALGVSIR